MLNKIAFLCTDPWERFLSVSRQSCCRKYYYWIKEIAVLKNIELSCREYIELYGSCGKETEQELFLEKSDRLQLLYVQSDRQELLKKIFHTADLVIMGLPGSRKEFDKIYMSVLPWKDEIMFLWGKHMNRDESYRNKLIRECMLRKEQMIEINENYDRIFG